MTETKLPNRCTRTEAERHLDRIEAECDSYDGSREEWIRKLATMNSHNLETAVDDLCRRFKNPTWSNLYEIYARTF